MSEQLAANATDVPAKDVIAPRCPHCGADPLNMMRLRYDFPDGVVCEVLFCAVPACRGAIGSQITYIPRPKPHESL